jgi:transcriptional regulator with XRE-family HTH domain
MTAKAINVRGLREMLSLSQNEFAAKFGFSPAVVRNWEQGRNQPAGAARILLAVIERHPEAVEETIDAWGPPISGGRGKVSMPVFKANLRKSRGDSKIRPIT